MTTDDNNDDPHSNNDFPAWAISKHDSLEWKRHDSLENTRHRTDYKVLSVLGRGGFGTAYKVRNRVDSKIYALKTVLLSRHQEDTGKVLREAEVLSSLFSDNVVRYYGAWIEKGASGMLEIANESSGGSGTATSGEFSMKGLAGDSWSNTSASAEQDSNQNTHPVCHLCQSSYKDWEVTFEHWGLIDAVLQPFDLCVPCYKLSIPGTVDASKISIREQEILHDHLFILMEYCESTLEKSVQGGNNDDEKTWSYFVQCVQGLAYLHSKGFSHRDLKPQNVFVHEGVVKIGDLGLATITASPKSSSPNTEMPLANGSFSAKSSQLGTFLYTAPEVRTGLYNEKCDVFSLGVLLVEIFNTFSTDMERFKVLSGLRSMPPSLPTEWVSSHPLQAELAYQMVATDPANRPSCSQILGDLLRKRIWKPASNVASMESLVADLTMQIVGLQSDAEKRKHETRELRQLLDAQGIDHSHIFSYKT